MSSYKLSPSRSFSKRLAAKELSADGVARVLKEFHEYDVNGDGKISMSELKKFLPKHTNKKTAAETLVRVGDFNGDRVIDFGEYLRMSQWKHMLGDEYETVFRRFKEFDKDGSGSVDIDELRKLLDEKSFKAIVKTKTPKFENDVEEYIIHQVDRNQDKRLNFGEFLQMAFTFRLRKKY